MAEKIVLILESTLYMFFSKSFGYAVRSVLYIASVKNENRYVTMEEITKELKMPRQFLGRILKILVKQGILSSIKGPNGGFALGKEGLKLKIVRILHVTDGDVLECCVLKSRKCDKDNPCPLHEAFDPLRKGLTERFFSITIGELTKGKGPDFLRRLG